VYSYHDVHRLSVEQYRAGATPFILIESTYENEYGAPTALLRRQAYESLLAGATGHVFGNNPIWHFDGPGLYPSGSDWRTELASAGTASMQRLKAIWDHLPWWTLAPDEQELLVAVNGGGTAIAALSCDGHLAVLYTVGGWTNVTVEIGALSGSTVTARWIDPTSGAVASTKTFDAAGGRAQLASPGVNASGDTDWLVILDSS
jgi:hypothetical protein